MTRLARAVALLSACTLPLLASCNADGVHPVKGQVIWKDTKQPAVELASSLISFEQANTQTSARGQIKPDGSFQLTTTNENDGAKLGEHVVLLMFFLWPSECIQLLMTVGTDDCPTAMFSPTALGL